MPHKLPYKEFLRQKLAHHVERQALRLYPDDEARRNAFVQAIIEAKAVLPALIWLVDKATTQPFQVTRLSGWQPEWVDVLLDPAAKPSRSPLYAEGAFYPLDFSSIATASALLAIDQRASRINHILDVCSAPGGKAIFAWRLLDPEELVCNEVIGKRHASLHGNLRRCGVPGEITKLDPGQLAARYPARFDLVMVDAPCSGQSLVARGQEAPGAFQDHLVNANMTRQRRILANAVACVAPHGYLMYSTCTYSREENEKNVEWLLRRFPELNAVEVPHLAAHRSTLTGAPCYRIEPQQELGAGGFVALFQRQAQP